jgi:transposase-like protein
LGVLVKISTSRIQDPAKRERIIAFQRWAFEALDRLLFEEFAPVPKLQAVLQPLFPSAPAKFKGDRATAAAMLTGDVRRRDGSLYSYSEIARITGVPGTTLRRMADRLGVRHLRRPPALPTPAKASDAELLRLLTDVLNRLYLHLAR